MHNSAALRCRSLNSGTAVDDLAVMDEKANAKTCRIRQYRHDRTP